MNKTLRILVLVGSLGAGPALAADNTVIVTPGSGVTIRSVDIGAGVQAPGHAIVDATGGQLGISGTPLYVRVPSAAIASGAYASGSVASGAIASGAVAAGALAAGAGVDGWDLTQGTIGDAAATQGSTGSISAKLRTVTSQLNTGNTSLATIASNTGAAIPTQAVTVPIGGVTNDPCQYATKVNFAIATSSGTLQVVAPSGATQVYVCSLSVVAAATAVVNLVGGTGASCTTGTPVAAIGSTTAASGMSLAANGGLTFGNGGATVVRTTTNGHGLCLIQSGTTALAGNITYVQQ